MMRSLLPLVMIAFGTAPAVAQDARTQLRGAEVQSDQAARAKTETRRRALSNQIKRELRRIEAAESPLIGANGGVVRQRFNQVVRDLDRLPEIVPREGRTGSKSQRSKILPLRPREVTIDPSVLDD